MSSRYILPITMALVGVTLMVCASYAFLTTYTASGPGCPGDPSYLGWCSDVDGS